MTRWIVALLAAGAGCARPGAAPADLSSADTEAIRAASQQYTRQASDTAWGAWAMNFTEDGIFLPPNTSAKEGRAAIEAWGHAFPPFNYLRIEPVEIVGRGDLAMVRGRYSLTLLLPGSPPAPDSGKYIEIWRKQGDGSWKLFRDIFNSDLPPPAPLAPPKALP